MGFVARCKIVTVGSAILVLFGATQAAAAPVYLKCLFPGEAGDFQVDVTADESASLVSLFMPSTGFSQQMRAVFTPDQVRFANNLMTYTLSRTNLTIERYTMMLRDTSVGQCSVVAAPKRAF